MKEKSSEKQGLKLAEDSIRSRPTSAGAYRQIISSRQLSDINSRARPERTNVPSDINWTNTDLKPEYLIGKEALYVKPTDCYNLHWPIRGGRFNLHSSPGGTLTSVLQHLETLWASAIEKHLGILKSEFKHYRVVLLIPDLYKRQHVRELVNVLLVRLGFGAAIVQQESVCGAFGAGVTSGCIVDVGDQKTNVCCVEDGLSLQKTRLCLEYGGSDITRCFYLLLAKACFPYRECKLNNKMDILFLQELKESCCHMDQDESGIEEQHIQVKHLEENIVKYSVQMADERIIAPMSVFYPDMFGLEGSKVCRVYKKCPSDPSDPHDEEYLSQTQSKQEQAAKAVAARKKGTTEPNQTLELDDSSLGPTQDDEDTVDMAESVVSVETPPMPSRSSKAKLEEEEDIWDPSKTIPGLDEAIIRSIDKCDNADMKRRMYTNIVVVGGGLSFSGAQDWLHYLLWKQMPAQFRITLESIEITTRPKDLDPQLTCWKGGAILAILDTAQEVWIKPREWQKFGTRVIRERAPFNW